MSIAYDFPVATAPASDKGYFRQCSLGLADKALVAAKPAIAALKFHINKIIYARFDGMAVGQKPEISAIGPMLFYTGRDEKGVMRGGNLHWNYVQPFWNAASTENEKFVTIRKTLARLPANVTFGFKVCPRLPEAAIIDSAFVASGFVNRPRTTYFYHGVPGEGDPIAKLKSDARTKVNSARRELELTDMALPDFFRFYRENIEASAKICHFHLDIDHSIMDQAWAENPSLFRVIAVRKKAQPGEAGQPVQAAIVCGRGTDGYYKMVRISYRVDAHKHAIKMLVVEAMRQATDLGMSLDSDGASLGGGTVYSRFGVFEAVEQAEYVRQTSQALVKKIIHKMNGKARTGLWQRLFTILPVLVFASRIRGA